MSCANQILKKDFLASLEKGTLTGFDPRFQTAYSATVTIAEFCKLNISLNKLI